MAENEVIGSKEVTKWRVEKLGCLTYLNIEVMTMETWMRKQRKTTIYKSNSSVNESNG